MPEMKSIYNLISDAFIYMREDELKYNIDVKYTEGFYRTYDITINSRNPSVLDVAIITLILNHTNRLTDYHDRNNLFLDEKWDRFCSVFGNQL
jgi:hypothetical protein